jgi:flagellar basal-body rod protein FlgG
MNSGMYSAVSGNISTMQRMDVITHNLANINTYGFKKDRMVFESVLKDAKIPTDAGGRVTDGPVIADFTIVTDFSPGSAKQTGNPLDISLDGDGFFVINTPDGKAYTRQGNFQLDSANRIVTSEGYELQGDGGPITIKGGKLEIDTKGAVFVDGQQVGTINVVDFPKPYNLQKIGSSLFVPSDPSAGEQPAVDTRVKQGSIEESNVQTISEMVLLIENCRAYEQCVKTIQSYDQMASKAANDLGRV